MSPASSGYLEVEKYIGACLISQSRPKSGTRDGFYQRVPEGYPGRWAGGMPLISFANHQKRKPEVPKDDQHTPLARLAVHTQGAPLILTKTFNRRNKPKKAFENSKQGKSPESQSVDAVSVTSDESSANSDNCLPRIIKPRKRRKKERKPSISGRCMSQDGFSTDSTSPDILRPFTPFIFDPQAYLVPENLPSNKPDEFDVSETPKLHHSFEDVQEVDDPLDINGNQSTTVCQCRYCDPAGQIWDVDRHCYSPFLTAPILEETFHFADLKVDSFLPLNRRENSCLVHSMASISLEDQKSLPVPSGDLEVSTEIVTSLNGHRDIEIKFFSSSTVENV